MAHPTTSDSLIYYTGMPIRASFARSMRRGRTRIPRHRSARPQDGSSARWEEGWRGSGTRRDQDAEEGSSFFAHRGRLIASSEYASRNEWSAGNRHCFPCVCQVEQRITVPGDSSGAYVTPDGSNLGTIRRIHGVDNLWLQRYRICAPCLARQCASIMSHPFP